MASRMKEDEKNEKIIRGLLKLPPNRRCINCNSLGPQYVCTNFWTFVCTTCSGIHREFTHRVKSVSMAKFTSQEVLSLQEGGNERARVIYFKDWDPQRQSAPDSSNVDRLRDFIKHVYVDRRYTGERGVEKPPRVKMGEKDDSYENRRFDTYRGSSQSPSYEDRYDRNYSDRSSLGGRTDDRNYRYNYDERRSPGYDQEPRYGDYRKSPGQFEVDDRRRDDRFGNGRRSEESRFSDGESRFDGRSPNHQKDVDTSSPPLVRPVRDILGEDAPPLRISGPPKPNDGKVADGSAKTQRTASSSSFGSVDTSSIDLKGGNSGSLIDFDADPEPPATTAAPPATRPTTSVVQSIPQPSATASSDVGNWASFDFAPQASVQTQIQAPVLTQTQAQSGNTLESLLSQLSAPATASVGFQTAGSGAPTVATVSDGAQTVVGNASLHINGGFTASPAGNVSTVPSTGGASVAAPGGVMSLPVAVDHGGQWSNTQQNQPSLLPANSMPIANQFTPSVGGAPNNQSWNSSFMQNVHGPLNATAQQSQAASRSIQETTGVSGLQPAPSEIKTTGRKELPEDLFTASYSTVRMPVPHWHVGISPGMGYGMQYTTAMPMHVMPMQIQQTQSFPRPLKPTNPFDLNSEPTLGHAQSFPSMTSLQGALPNVAAPLGLVHSSSLGAMPSQWLPTQSPSLASAMPQSVYMGQQLHTNVQALGHQGSSGFGSNAASFGTINSDPQMGGRYSLPATPNSFSSAGGNPFG